MDSIECPRCGEEHEPAGNHEDDFGYMDCEACGFTFFVDIDYEPTYSTRCKEHEYGDWKIVTHRNEDVTCRFCDHCGHCQLKEEING